MVTIGDFEFPEDRMYSDNHLWIFQEGSSVTVGVDPMGFAIAGDISMIRVKKVGKSMKKGRAFGTMESGKGVISLKSPFNGTITEVNPVVQDKQFDSIKENPYETWLIKAELSDTSELDGLMKTVAEISKWAKEELSQL
ncbi:glycine cleavage system protein H [Candidatus Bathyarchaeota archaeon]|nr:glycine cleavage system protein H [Candidatus Bathyarchaeota archaeon]